MFFFAAAAQAAVTLPIEVMGPGGTVVAVAVTLPPGTASTVDHLYLRLHNAGYIASYQALHNLMDKASLQINNGPWVNLDNNTVTLFPHDLAAGGFGGGFSTIRGTLPIPAGSALQDGANTLRFRFNQTDGVSSGFRVVDFNFQSNGVKVLQPGAFVQEDPYVWTAPTGADPVRGKSLWQTAALKSSPLSNATQIGARCMDCHAKDGRDLKYFNYSNYSIHARSMFHGLSDQDGWDIAAYIRSLSAYQSKAGRPWNPPYQPGPGLDSKPVQEWAAGAGIDAVLGNDADMLPYLFPNGQIQDNSIVNPRGHMNTRETPVEVQLLDWNHWLPKIHPMDAWPSAWAGSNVEGLYEGLRNRLSAASPITAAVFAKNGFNLALEEFETTLGNFLMPFDAGNSPGNEDVALKIYSARLWDLVKNWELMQEFNLETVGHVVHPPIDPTLSTEPRGWFQYPAFEASPLLNHINPSTDQGTPGHSLRAMHYEANMWYQLQITLNSYRWNADIRPIDWGYNYGFHAGFQREFWPMPARWIYWIVAGGQVSTNGWGPENAASGWTPATKMEPSSLAHFSDALNLMLGDQMSLSAWRSAVQVMLTNWLSRNKEYRPEQYYTTISYMRPMVKDPNYVPQGWAAAQEPADYWWTMIPKFRADGINETLLGQMLDWFKTIYPKADWDALRSPSVLVAPSISLIVSPQEAIAPGTISLSADPFNPSYPVTKMEFWAAGAPNNWDYHGGAVKLGESAFQAPDQYYHFTWSNVPAGTYEVSARSIYANGTYFPSGDQPLTVSGSGGPAAPVIQSFTTSANTVSPGDAVTLSWNVNSAQRLYLTPVLGADALAASGSLQVFPGLSTTYILTAVNLGGTVKGQVTVQVTQPLALPVITVQPVSVSASVGQNVAFVTIANSVDVTDDANLWTRQWQVLAPGSATWTTPNPAKLNPATGSQRGYIDLVNVQLSDNGTQYRSTVTNAAGTVTSQAATLAIVSPCDINYDGSINVQDIQFEVNQVVGTVQCTVDINHDGSCNVIDVQRVVNAAMGGACVSP